MQSTESQIIPSVLLGTAAYEKASGKRPVAKPRRAAAAKGRHDPKQQEQASRELKASVLRDLHAQSNAGLVSIRDVSAALDQMLRRRG